MKIVGDQIVVTKAGTRFYLDGEEVTERAYRKRHPLRTDGPLGYGRNAKVQRSVALAVHPDQRAEAIEDALKKGVPTHFAADGRPEFTSREHRKQYMRAYGFFDRDAGYGDQAPQQHKGDKAPPSRLREAARRLADRINLRRESRLEDHR